MVVHVARVLSRESNRPAKKQKGREHYEKILQFIGKSFPLLFLGEIIREKFNQLHGEKSRQHIFLLLFTFTATSVAVNFPPNFLFILQLKKTRMSHHKLDFLFFFMLFSVIIID